MAWILEIQKNNNNKKEATGIEEYMEGLGWMSFSSDLKSQKKKNDIN